jgi:hypothetical protein
VLLLGIALVLVTFIESTWPADIRERQQRMNRHAP